MKVAYATIVYKNRRQKYYLFRYKPQNFVKFFTKKPKSFQSEILFLKRAVECTGNTIAIFYNPSVFHTIFLVHLPHIVRLCVRGGRRSAGHDTNALFLARCETTDEQEQDDCEKPILFHDNFLLKQGGKNTNKLRIENGKLKTTWFLTNLPPLHCSSGGRGVRSCPSRPKAPVGRWRQDDERTVPDHHTLRKWHVSW